MNNRESIAEYIEDADDNYTTGRHMDAAKGFAHVAELLVNDDQFIDSLYHFFRAIHSFDLADKKLEVANYTRRLGSLCLKRAVSMYSKLSEKSNTKLEKEEFHYINQDILKQLGLETERRQSINTLLDVYPELLVNENLDYHNMKNLFKRYINLSKVTFQENHIKQSQQMFAEYLLDYHEGNYQPIDDDTDQFEVVNLYAIANDLLKAASYAKQIDDFHLFRLCMSEFISINIPDEDITSLDFNMYGLPFINNEKELDEFINKLRHVDFIFDDAEPDHIIIDAGSVLKQDNKPDQKGSSKRIRNVIDHIESEFAFKNISVIVEPKIKEYIDNIHYLKYLEEMDYLVTIPENSSISYFIFKLASANNSIILSNRKFEYYRNDETKEFINQRVCSFIIDNTDKNKVIIDSKVKNEFD